MLGLPALQELLGQIRYKDWTFFIGNWAQREAVYLQVRYRRGKGADAEVVRGRRWLISDQMTPSEIIQAALHAVLREEEQIVRKNFTYRGHAFADPETLNIEQLMRLCFGVQPFGTGELGDRSETDQPKKATRASADGVTQAAPNLSANIRPPIHTNE